MEKCKECVCFTCGTAVDAGGECTNCEECIKRENAITECDNATPLNE